MSNTDIFGANKHKIYYDVTGEIVCLECAQEMERTIGNRAIHGEKFAHKRTKCTTCHKFILPDPGWDYTKES